MTTNISNLHLDILDKQRQELLTILIPFTKGFVLGGGTSLALQLGHRSSFDFDFFSSSPIQKNLLEKVAQIVPIENVAVDSLDELTLFTKNAIKVTFLYYPFKDVFPFVTLDTGLQLFSIKDIAVKKAYTIGRRGEYRDYFDLYSILKDKYISLSELISFSKQVYGSVFDEKIFLQQLVYFDDLLNFEITPPTIRPLPTPEEVKQFFEEQVEKYID